MSPQKQLNLREKRDIGQVVNASFAFLRLSYFKMFGSLLLFSVPFFAISGMCIGIVQFSYPSIFASFYEGYLTNPYYYLSIISGLIGYVVCFGIVGNFIYQNSQTGSTQLDKAAIMRRTWKFFQGLLTVSFLYYGATLLVIIALVIPGLYYSIANVLCRPAYILENKSESERMGIGESFGESRRLIDDNWWRTFGLFYILYFLVSFVAFVFVIPEVVVKFIVTFNAAKGVDMDDYRIYYMISTVIARIGEGLIEPVSVAAFFIYYFSLKETKDQTDLMASIENIGVKTTFTTGQ